ncbi:MAG: restriction endonuclease subunit S [Planctomycetes bacterium]|nr:restriction endonuclease subunit S [Planctomycetota bacterium]
MAGEWPVLSLREAGVALIDCEHRTPPGSDSGYPYIAIPQIKHGRLHLAGVRRITREHFLDWTRKAQPQPYDVVLSRRCNPGETAFIPPRLECALGQNLVLLRADGTRVLPHFLRWLVRGAAWWEQIGKFINVGAVFDSLKCADIPNFRLPIPPVPEQRNIAHILGSLDDKIELNRRMNETLEATARAIFKSWFVDFDPVRAKLNGQKPVGMDEQTAGLFPDGFDNSSLGKIPGGWHVGRLDELLVLQRGFDLPKSKRIPGPYPLLSASGPIDTHIEPRANGPGVVTGRSGLLGEVFYVLEDFWPLNTTLWVKEFRVARPFFAYHHLQTLDFEVFNAGSAVPTLNRNHVHNLPTVIPDERLVRRFD